ncbi:IspD/TarI family cytidylyltransferase [Agreia sp. PsM10]|uniref:IspD/TarI family cytidylyltransferase n=1 Tax=Agreia sp. PsM10 TaxID=3030533 RepID=UPI00263AF8A0|nr:IspD/TarI family cytidylyltransferase [Agreia sp. PsM10]MDN4641983.1 IspD/TarI family cytidylyltransferase [Agreia sp. PsM10]
MNVALIFAGGVGRRMNQSALPKQFLELNGKPVIIHTLEHFQHHPEIDAIAIACVEDWIDHLRELLDEYGMTKVRWLVPGGATGQLSIYNGLKAITADLERTNPVVLIHDAVRPLINADLISRNIASVRELGSGVTCSVVKETILIADGDEYVAEITDRAQTRIARAPQSFLLNDIYQGHISALERGFDDCIDSCSIMQLGGHPVRLVDGPHENIKITTPGDFFVFRALHEATQNQQIFG